MTNLYALGWTGAFRGHPRNIRSMAIIQQLLGNMGMAGAVSTLRGHSNVQGITDMCLYSGRTAGLPGCAAGLRPTEDLSGKTHAQGTASQNQMNFPQNFPNGGQPDEVFLRQRKPRRERLLLRLVAQAGDVSTTCWPMFDRMYQGKMTGLCVCQGFQTWPRWPTRKRWATRWPS